MDDLQTSNLLLNCGLEVDGHCGRMRRKRVPGEQARLALTHHDVDVVSRFLCRKADHKQ
jgi:hypothetical protein